MALECNSNCGDHWFDTSTRTKGSDCTANCSCNGNHCSRTGCKSNTNITVNWLTGEIISSDGTPTICYSYGQLQKPTCESYSNICNATDGTHYVYSCKGHRDYDSSRNFEFKQYSGQPSPTLVMHEQINSIQSAIRQEINERKSHDAYHNNDTIRYSNSDITAGELAEAAQLNAIDTAINSLKTYIIKIDDHKSTITGGGNAVKSKDTMYAKDLHALEPHLNTMHNDCICYTDCTAYGLWKYKMCSCNINCKCNY